MCSSFVSFLMEKNAPSCLDAQTDRQQTNSFLLFALPCGTKSTLVYNNEAPPQMARQPKRREEGGREVQFTHCLLIISALQALVERPKEIATFSSSQRRISSCSCSLFQVSSHLPRLEARVWLRSLGNEERNISPSQRQRVK